MQNIAVIRLVRGRLAWYPPGAGDEPLWLDDDGAREQLQAALSQRRVVPLFAVPGEEVRLLRLQVSVEERKHLAKSLPFMLEEEVAGDIDDLHFASHHLGQLDYSAAICTVEKMEEWQALLADCGPVGQWVPEPLLLPWQSGEWSLVMEQQGGIVRTGECEGFSVERELVPPLLAAVLAEGNEPQAVIVYGADQAADTALLPQRVADRVQWRRGGLCTAMMLADHTLPALNLLQGEYAPRLPLGRWWRQWRSVAALFGVALSLQLLATYVDYLGLRRENQALRAAVQESYRQAYPRGAVVDAEKQLRRQLDALRGSARSSGFVRLMERVGGVVATRPGTRIATINYSDRGGEMRLNIVAADFEAVEQVRAAINQAGLSAVMESSSAQGEKVRARLRVGERS